MNKKKCTVCRVKKPISEFYRRKDRPIGVASECKTCKALAVGKYTDENKGKVYSKQKDWRRKNKKKIRDNKREYYTNKIKTDIQFKIRQILRDRLRKALRHNLKTGSAVGDLGCSVEYFKQYIEQKFKPDMSWENHGHGKDKWNIDHIKPLCNFDLTDRKQLLEVCHYTNLQPLWQEENFKKGGR